jgi:peptidyl-prolyl cis-trans isomerase
MQGVQAAQRFKDDSTLNKAMFMAGFKKALGIDSATRVVLSDSLNVIAQKYYELKAEADRKKYEAEMEKQMEEQYGENKTKGAAFIAEFKKEAGVKTTASGLAYQVIKEGNGATPTATDQVQVNYVGKLIDGTVFDESKGKPAEFRVDGVIKGWTEILQLMKAGSKVKVVIPQDLAYGARYAGEKIPPFSTLVFEIELVKVLPAAAADSTSADEL